MADGWEPEQYARFASERRRPFWDLLDLVQPVPGGKVVDLGCGSGELTAELHKRLMPATTFGIDSSPAMLERAQEHAGGGVAFREADISEVDVAGADVVFSNAALQWVPDHEAVIERVAGQLEKGGQLAFQVPANSDHPSHTVIAEVAAQPRMQALMTAPPPLDVVRGVLPPERYAELLDRLGFTEQHVRLQVYGHHLASTEEVVEWTKGTSLVRFRRIMEPEAFELFVSAYRERLLSVLGERRPYFYAFKRILAWGRRA